MSDLNKEIGVRKEFLICVDSDGCAIDTMEVKHVKCFGPCMVEVWGLQQWEDEILDRWNVINLYSMTRGINRFKGLLMALQEIDKKYTPIEGLDDFYDWCEITSQLSNKSLEEEINKVDSVCLKKALEWSNAVNASIKKLPNEEKKAFVGVKEALAKVKEEANIAVVSSANREAVLEEWEEHGLLEYVDVIFAQDAGTKSKCIADLLELGYNRANVVMVGDAPGDYDAATKNGVFFYPILVKKETQSWKEFEENGWSHLKEGTYAGAYASEKYRQFKENLSAK